MPLVIIILLVVIILVLSPFWLGVFVSLLAFSIGVPAYVIYEHGWTIAIWGGIFLLIFCVAMGMTMKTDKGKTMWDRGMAHKLGQKGADKNPHKAAEWFRKASELGHAPSMFLLACAFKDGEGIERDSKSARYWLQQAAANGESRAMLALARAYRDGDGFEKDLVSAEPWFRKAVEGREPDAREELAALEKKLAVIRKKEAEDKQQGWGE